MNTLRVRPDTDVRFEWSKVTPFQFNENLSLPDFRFNRDDIELKRCDKKYETGTYSCIEARFHLSRLLGYYLLGLYIPTARVVKIAAKNYKILIEFLVEFFCFFFVLLCFTTLPTALAVVLSYLSFWIDPTNAPARICIGIFANLRNVLHFNIFSELKYNTIMCT